LGLQVGRQRGLTDEIRREHTGQAFLAAADVSLDGVLGFCPAQGQPEFGEGLVVGRQMPVTLGVGKHPVAIEDQRAHAAFPLLWKQRLCPIRAL
jgi:hypothetical protein